MFMKKRLHIIYSGMVQGVGFRFAAERAAQSLALKGWARNNPDGAVEVIAEGEEERLIQFIDKVKKAMAYYIKNANVAWEDYTGEFEAFDIRFY